VRRPQSTCASDSGLFDTAEDRHLRRRRRRLQPGRRRRLHQAQRAADAHRRLGESLLAVTGNATFKHIVDDYFGSFDTPPALDSVGDIFRTWNRMHGEFKERYFLQAEEDKEDAIESTRLDVLIANPHGIFGVSGQRTVQEFSRFYAYGSGGDYALGALWTVYGRDDLDAEAVARHGILAAIEFDDGTGAPVESFTIPLAAGR
jgi:ATP-dependent HslUV protease, peptidase subunit HslV